jgi:hypothetical protein
VLNPALGNQREMREAGFYLNTIYLVSVIASSVIVAEEAFFLNKKTELSTIHIG